MRDDLDTLHTLGPVNHCASFAYYFAYYYARDLMSLFCAPVTKQRLWPSSRNVA
jgi:hypothetical protein